MREVVAVGRAQGVALADDYAEVRLRLADDVAYDMTSSMHHDLERGHRLEVRWLAGGVVALGREKGVATPLNRAIADILELHADGQAPPSPAPKPARGAWTAAPAMAAAVIAALVFGVESAAPLTAAHAAVDAMAWGPAGRR